MRYWFDQMEYDGQTFHVVGWAMPETNGDRMTAELQDMDGHPVDCEIRYIDRPDVTQMFYHEDSKAPYGFAFDYAVLEDRYIFFKSLDHDFDFNGITLEFPLLAASWKKKKPFYTDWRKNMNNNPGTGKKD